MTRFVRRSDGRIRAKENFDVVLPTGIRHILKDEHGDVIENLKNLSQEGTCWVFPGAEVRGNARVTNDAVIFSSEPLAP